MTPEFDPKDPSTGCSELRWVSFARLLPKLGGGVLSAVTADVVLANNCEVDVSLEEAPLTVEVLDFEATGLVTVRLTGGTNKTVRYIRFRYTITTAHGPYTKDFTVRIAVRHT